MWGVGVGENCEVELGWAMGLWEGDWWEGVWGVGWGLDRKSDQSCLSFLEVGGLGPLVGL